MAAIYRRKNDMDSARRGAVRNTRFAAGGGLLSVDGCKDQIRNRSVGNSPARIAQVIGSEQAGLPTRSRGKKGRREPKPTDKKMVMLGLIRRVRDVIPDAR